MGILVLFVPVLLVVVIGYAIGYAVWDATGFPGNPEVVGWLTGLFLLTVLTWALLAWYRRRRRRS